MESLYFHPRIVHFPIALAMLMPFVLGVLLLAWWRGWLPHKAWWLGVALQLVLVGSGFLAVRSGEVEEERVEEVVPHDAVVAHEHSGQRLLFASIAVLIGTALAGAFAQRQIGLPLGVACLLGSLVVLAFGYETGKEGGALVYRHGAAQVYVTGAAKTPDEGRPALQPVP